MPQQDLAKANLFISESQKTTKIFARFSLLASELNVLTITSSLIMGNMHKLNMLKAAFA